MTYSPIPRDDGRPKLSLEQRGVLFVLWYLRIFGWVAASVAVLIGIWSAFSSEFWADDSRLIQSIVILAMVIAVALAFSLLSTKALKWYRKQIAAKPGPQ